MIATKKQLTLELFLISRSNSFHDAEQSTSSIGQTEIKMVISGYV
jgi:hypothetical protein